MTSSKRHSVSRALTVAALLATIAFAPAALAEEEAPERPAEKSWYGWQTLIVDTAATAITIDGLFRGDCFVRNRCAEAEIGLGAFALGAPAVHVAHGSAAKAGASLAIHVLGPPLVGGIGLGSGVLLGAGLTGGDAFGMTLLGAVGLVLGVGVGWFGAIAVDAAALGYTTPDAPRPSTARLTLQPSMAIVPGRASAGLGGTF